MMFGSSGNDVRENSIQRGEERYAEDFYCGLAHGANMFSGFGLLP